MAEVNLARFTINGTASDDGSGNAGFTGFNAQVLTLTLEVDPAPVIAVTYSVFDPNISDTPLASFNADVLTWNENSLSLFTPAAPNDDATITLPASGAQSYVLRAEVSTPSGPQRFDRLVIIESAELLRKTVPAESTEFSARGWSDSLNDIIDVIDTIAGAGASSLTATLAIGNTTTGFDIIQSNTDVFIGETGGTGAPLALIGGTGTAGLAGELTLDGGLSSGGNGAGGIVRITGGVPDGTGASGALIVTTPTAETGGAIFVQVGNSTVSVGSPLDLRAGNSTLADGGDVDIRSGISSAGAGGNIQLFPGNGTTDPGVVTIVGNGSGLQIQELAAVPVTPPASQGTFWVRSDSPNVPMFTNDVGTDFVINTSGGTLAATLGQGATTGGLNIILTNGDQIRGETLPTGGAALFFGGTGSAGAGGAVTVTAGSGTTTGGLLSMNGGAGATGAAANIRGGQGTGGVGGDASLVGGQGSTTGGNVTITGGVGLAGVGGDVTIKGQAGSTPGGQVTLNTGSTSVDVSNIIFQQNNTEFVRFGQVTAPTGAPSTLNIVFNPASGSAGIGMDDNVGAGPAFGVYAGSGTTAAGDLTLNAGQASAGAGGGVIVQGGQGTTAGGPIDIFSGTATSAGAGGLIRVTSGNGAGANASGAIALLTGTAGITGSGGGITLTTAAGGATAGAGGAITLQAGASTGANGGANVLITAGNSGTVGTGGNVNITGGVGGTGSGQGGDIGITTGAAATALAASGSIIISTGIAGSSGGGGDIDIISADSGASGGEGGNARLQSGGGFNDGGTLTIEAGNSFGTGLGGPVVISSGNGGTDNSGGQISITGGNGNGDGNGAAIVIEGGQSGVGNADGGDITFRTHLGSGTGRPGIFLIQGDVPTIVMDAQASDPTAAIIPSTLGTYWIDSADDNYPAFTDGTGTSGRIYSEQALGTELLATVTTVNATPVTIGTVSTSTNNSVTMVSLKMMAIDTTDNETATWDATFTIQRTDGIAAVTVDNEGFFHVFKTDLSWDVGTSVSGQNVNITVTGDSANNTAFRLVATILEHS